MTTNTRTNTSMRYRELNAILDRARRDPESVGSISDEQLRGLQSRWTRALASRLDQAIECAGPEPLLDTVAAAWRQLADEQAPLRAVLDAAEQRSDRLDARVEFRYLALAVGSLGAHDSDEEAVRQGRAYRDLIRAGTSQRRAHKSTWHVFSRAG